MVSIFKCWEGDGLDSIIFSHFPSLAHVSPRYKDKCNTDFSCLHLICSYKAVFRQLAFFFFKSVFTLRYVNFICMCTLLNLVLKCDSFCQLFNEVLK